METKQLPADRMGLTYAIATVAFILIYFAARAILELDSLAQSVRVLVALAPVPAFAYFIYANVRAARQSDELEKRIQFEALAFAFPVAMGFIFTLGLLELAVELPRDDWSYRHVFALMPIMYFFGLFLARRRYQ